MKNFNYKAMQWGLFWGFRNKLYVPSIIHLCVVSVIAYFVWHFAQTTDTFLLAMVILFSFGIGGSLLWGYMGNQWLDKYGKVREM